MNISHIAKFVKVKARAANSPVFGCVVEVRRERSENLRRNQKGGASSEERLSTFNTRETKPGVDQSSPSQLCGIGSLFTYSLCSFIYRLVFSHRIT